VVAEEKRGGAIGELLALTKEDLLIGGSKVGRRNKTRLKSSKRRRGRHPPRERDILADLQKGDRHAQRKGAKT